MKAIEARITALEQKASHQAGGGLGIVVSPREGETFEEAAKRQGFTAGGYLCIGETMTPEAWDAAARVQQETLTQH